jgi:hypothetical protein
MPQLLPLSGVSAISLFHRGSFAYVSFTLPTPSGEDWYRELMLELGK